MTRVPWRFQSTWFLEEVGGAKGKVLVPALILARVDGGRPPENDCDLCGGWVPVS